MTKRLLQAQRSNTCAGDFPCARAMPTMVPSSNVPVRPLPR
ncbi:hypothetical protein VA596_01960 [Amycolatopsis sp., V23-08]|uniref:Uncharacterized protein n=1 Tax=Amycolatopsis heterodermiae TaxID=3110235 RepID=A0ABU5QWJ3_9PSEU|nr:hypothetical protein [Amycolatopsis sp., V23-08]MEA5358287.1 hypothetical protein [Amycolatopsis sp., V23-08]